MTTPLAVTVSTLISANLADEADLMIYEADPAQGLVIYWYRTWSIKLTPKANNPMAGLPVTITYAAQGSPLEGFIRSTTYFNVEQKNYS